MIRPTLLAMVAACAFTGAARSAPPARLAGAEAFLRRLYAPYLAGDAHVDPTGHAAPLLFDGALTRLIRRDQVEAKGEVGRLDEDPICDCQDFDRLAAFSVRITPRGARGAFAVVRFRNGSHATVLRYTLTRSAAGWRISDIVGGGRPSLLAALRAPL